MLNAKEIMDTELVAVDPYDTIGRAMSLMVDHRLSSLPVVDKTGRVLGVISDRDVTDLIDNCATENERVVRYMSSDVAKIDEEHDWVNVADAFRSSNLHRLPVTHDGKLVGTITRHDLMHTVEETRRRTRRLFSRPDSAASPAEGSGIQADPPHSIQPPKVHSATHGVPLATDLDLADEP